ncbi:MAG TPA: response regulator [Gemmataceae bacterium]|nr:response regulator [Gemmataceae bacterium]
MTAPAQFVHPSARPLRVLLADDNHDCTDSLAQLLSLAGCEVQVCYNGGAVLTLAEYFRPDVCVLDVRMPVLDGWRVGPLLRAWAGERLLLLIALTGVGGRQAEENSLYAEFDHHIVKPGDPQELYGDFANFIKRMESAVLAIA